MFFRQAGIEFFCLCKPMVKTFHICVYLKEFKVEKSKVYNKFWKYIGIRQSKCICTFVYEYHCILKKQTAKTKPAFYLKTCFLVFVNICPILLSTDKLYVYQLIYLSVYVQISLSPPPFSHYERKCLQCLSKSFTLNYQQSFGKDPKYPLEPIPFIQTKIQNQNLNPSSLSRRKYRTRSQNQRKSDKTQTQSPNQKQNQVQICNDDQNLIDTELYLEPELQRTNTKFNQNYIYKQNFIDPELNRSRLIHKTRTKQNQNYTQNQTYMNPELHITRTTQTQNYKNQKSIEPELHRS